MNHINCNLHSDTVLHLDFLASLWTIVMVTVVFLCCYLKFQQITAQVNHVEKLMDAISTFHFLLVSVLAVLGLSNITIKGNFSPSVNWNTTSHLFPFPFDIFFWNLKAKCILLSCPAKIKWAIKFSDDHCTSLRISFCLLCKIFSFSFNSDSWKQAMN